MQEGCYRQRAEPPKGWKEYNSNYWYQDNKDRQRTFMCKTCKGKSSSQRLARKGSCPVKKRET